MRNLIITMYSVAVNEVTELKHRAEEGCELMCNMPQISGSVQQSLMRCARNMCKHKDSWVSFSHCGYQKGNL
jgi:hypothetical protein